MMQANPDSAALLEQLRDIHAAPAPGWWPPAPGWWVLALLLAVAVLFAARALARRYAISRRRRRWLSALDELQGMFDPRQHPREYLAGLNRLFRAVALRAFPGAGCARLEGGEWVDFLRERTPLPETRDSLAALASGPYEPAPEFDAAALAGQARAWVMRYG